MNLRNLYRSGIAAVCMGVVPAAHASIVISYEAPGVESSQVAGVTTETFDNYATGDNAAPLTGPVGTYSTGGKVNPFDQYGGAGETGKYLAVGNQSGHTDVTLTLAHHDAYFGMWFTAGDNQNVLSFYNNNSLIGSMNTQTVINAIKGAGSAYYGKPGTGQDTSEPFAYLNFFGTNGTQFDRIQIHNLSLGTGFESDNHSILLGSVTPTGTIVNGGFTPAPVPEPAAPVVFAFGAAATAAMLLRNRRRGAAGA